MCRFFTALIYRERRKTISFSVSEKMLKQCQYSPDNTAVSVLLPKFLFAAMPLFNNIDNQLDAAVSVY